MLFVRKMIATLLLTSCLVLNFAISSDRTLTDQEIEDAAFTGAYPDWYIDNLRRRKDCTTIVLGDQKKTIRNIDLKRFDILVALKEISGHHYDPVEPGCEILEIPENEILSRNDIETLNALLNISTRDAYQYTLDMIEYTPTILTKLIYLADYLGLHDEDSRYKLLSRVRDKASPELAEIVSSIVPNTVGFSDRFLGLGNVKIAEYDRVKRIFRSPDCSLYFIEFRNGYGQMFNVMTGDKIGNLVQINNPIRDDGDYAEVFFVDATEFFIRDSVFTNLYSSITGVLISDNAENKFQEYLANPGKIEGIKISFDGHGNRKDYIAVNGNYHLTDKEHKLGFDNCLQALYLDWPSKIDIVQKINYDGIPFSEQILIEYIIKKFNDTKLPVVLETKYWALLSEHAKNILTRLPYLAPPHEL